MCLHFSVLNVFEEKMDVWWPEMVNKSVNIVWHPVDMPHLYIFLYLSICIFWEFLYFCGIVLVFLYIGQHPVDIFVYLCMYLFLFAFAYLSTFSWYARILDPEMGAIIDCLSTNKECKFLTQQMKVTFTKVEHIEQLQYWLFAFGRVCPNWN